MACQNLLVDIEPIGQCPGGNNWECDSSWETCVDNVCTVEDWKLWGCEYQDCPPGSPTLQCVPAEFGNCHCYPMEGYPFIDDCGRCNTTENQNIDDPVGCGCCLSNCAGCSGGADICQDEGCVSEGGNYYYCCELSGADCGLGGGEDGIPGCMDPNATNYNPLATVDDDSCEYDGVLGCTDQFASNFYTQPKCSVEAPEGCESGCVSDECPGIDDGSCQYEGYSEPSIDRLWTFKVTELEPDGEVLNLITEFIDNNCTQYNCSNTDLIPIGDISNIYYGQVYMQDGTLIEENVDSTIFAFIGTEIRGVANIKSIPNYSYFYMEVKWNHSSESGEQIRFYFKNSETFKLSEIYKVGEDTSMEYDITSDYGLF